MLYYCGRIDLQIKLHGYRIELGDIESNLLKLPGIKNAAAVANMRDGKAKVLPLSLSRKMSRKMSLQNRCASDRI